MAKKPNRKIETPGAAQNSPPPAASAATPVGGDSGASPQPGGAESTPPVDPTAAVVPPTTDPALANSATADALKTAELDRRVQATAHLVGSPAALDWGHLTAPERLMSVVGANAPDRDPDAHLPAVESVDWSKIAKGTDRILTKQGWLLRP